MTSVVSPGISHRPAQIRNRDMKPDMFDVVMAYTIVLFPIWGMLLRLAVNMSVIYITTFLFFFGSIFVLVRAYQQGQLELPIYFNIYALFVTYTVILNFLYTDLPYVDGVFKFFYSNYLVTSLLGLFVALNIRLNAVWLRRLIKIMTAIVIFAGITSLIQFFDPDFLVDKSNLAAVEAKSAKYGDRKWSIYTWGNYTDIGFSFLSYISIIFSIGMVFSRRQYWLVFLGFLVSLLNGSRWVILNAIVISLQDFLATRNRFAQFIRFSIYSVVLLALVYGTLILIGVDLNKLIYDRLFQESASTRLVAVEVFLDQFPKAPIIGTGGDYTAETIRLIAGRSSQIHVGFLAIFYLYGIIGGLLFISFLYSILKRMGAVAQKTNYWGSYYAFLGLALANLTLVTFGVYYHGLLLAVIFHNFFKRNAHQINSSSKVKVAKPKTSDTVKAV